MPWLERVRRLVAAAVDDPRLVRPLDEPAPTGVLLDERALPPLQLADPVVDLFPRFAKAGELAARRLVVRASVGLPFHRDQFALNVMAEAL
jgi:hypothetical protein